MAGQPGNLAWYLSLVTNQHNQRPNFMATLAALLAPLCNLYSVVRSIPTLYDLDVATGQQLDVVGAWVGASRVVTVNVTGVYFTLDIGPGLDQGILFGGSDAVISTQVLPDANYRTLIRATVANNHWDGTIPGAYAATSIWTVPLGLTLLIHDYQDMTVSFDLFGGTPDAITLLLFNAGLLVPRSEGVGVRSYASQVTGPVFALDSVLRDARGNALTAGLDQGHFASFSFPTGAY